jgi:hypothetical protein
MHVAEVEKVPLEQHHDTGDEPDELARASDETVGDALRRRESDQDPQRRTDAFGRPDPRRG